jgi:DnaJ-class molecular chaperone|tara:strand:- start:310 stop:447 length:138 start_codon:yes stop_codon:yes gene_type:complete
MKKCETCDGTGKQEVDSYDISNILEDPIVTLETCYDCKGTGERDD